MKIKRKIEMNLPQLIEYAWENGIENKEYPCVGFESKTVIFNGIGWAEFSDEYSYNSTDTFTVTTEEEITEDTEFTILVLIEKNNLSATWGNASINKVKDDLSKEFHAYIDGEFKLIWTNEKGLVE